jgi:hypothetical protein
MSAIKLSTPSSGSISLSPADTASNLTITVPASTTTMVGTNTTQTLTNKTIEGGTVISGTAVASTSGTSIDFTGIPSWAKRITVMFSGVSSSGTSIRQVQLGDSGGIENTGYVGSAFAWTGGGGGTANSAGFLLEGQPSNTAANNFSGILTICNFTGNTWVSSGTFCSQTTANQNFSGGTKTLSDTLTQIRITSVNGTDTFDAGSINILYE